jgi:hypothetical protein
MPQTRYVDRSLAKLVATKRIVTGSLSLAAGVATIAAVAMHGGSFPLMAAVALLIFFGGGAWTLRDGIRLRTLLRESAPGSPSPATVDEG